MTVSIAALNNLVSIVLKLSVKEKASVSENITETIKLLSNLDHKKTLISKSLIVMNINTKLRDTLKLTPSGE